MSVPIATNSFLGKDPRGARVRGIHGRVSYQSICICTKARFGFAVGRCCAVGAEITRQGYSRMSLFIELIERLLISFEKRQPTWCC